MKLTELDLPNQPFSVCETSQEPSEPDDDEAEEEEDTWEEQITEAADLLETCHKVLKHICKQEPRFLTSYNENLLADIAFFITSLDMDLED
jgi:hypothetical protein